MNYASDDLNTALSVLQQGGVILYPTDTVWGIGCDATNEAAVRRVFRIKQRDDSKALILLLDSPDSLRQYVPLDCLSDKLFAGLARPTTIIYPKVRNVPAFLKAEDGSVAIRLTKEPFSHDLCAALQRPLVSTSANISGQPTPQCFGQIDPQILGAVDYVCRYRQDDTAHVQPSTILRLNNDDEGSISFITIRP